MPHFGLPECVVLLVVFFLVIGAPIGAAFFVMEVMRAIKRVLTETNTASSRDDPVEKLEQLKRMLDVGLISVQEYEAKKKEILSRI